MVRTCSGKCSGWGSHCVKLFRGNATDRTLYATRASPLTQGIADEPKKWTEVASKVFFQWSPNPSQHRSFQSLFAMNVQFHSITLTCLMMASIGCNSSFESSSEPPIAKMDRYLYQCFDGGPAHSSREYSCDQLGRPRDGRRRTRPKH